MVQVRLGSLRASFRAADMSPRVLFSVPRSVGNAVTRNRVRRRLREALRELERDGSVSLERGEYRLGASAPLEHLSPTELRSALLKLTQSLRRRP